MGAETHPQILRPEPIVHPRQQYLLGLLRRPSLPQGAGELIREAIAEYDSAFGGIRIARPDGRIAQTNFCASLPDDGEKGVILAGKNHLLTVRFSSSDQGVEPSEDAYTHMMVVVSMRNFPGVNLYPDFLRYVPIDAIGNSRATRFLLEVPDTLRGYSGRIELAAFNGASLAVRLSGELRLR